MEYVDLEISEIAEFLIKNKQRTNCILMGWSFVFQYDKYPDLFPDGNSIIKDYRRLTTYVVQFYNNNGFRARRVNGQNNTDKIQIFR